MEQEQQFPSGPDDPMFMEARAISLSVAAMRRARGIRNPSDYEVGSPEWHAAMHEFAEEVMQAIGTRLSAGDSDAGTGNGRR
jgi:hypothetical protein